jgi:hypothetical protein
LFTVLVSLLESCYLRLKEKERFSNNRLQFPTVHWSVLPSTPQICASSAARSIRDLPTPNRVTVRQAFLLLLREPVKYLFHRWNWKSAVLSSILRAFLFFATNLSAGLPAAVAAMNTEFVFRGVTSGFYGAMTEAFREAEPPWAAAATVMLLLPIANHSIEFLVHWLRGTQKLLPSIIASMILTAFSTLFNFYVMRRGALIVGSGHRSLGTDLLRLPRLAVDFVTWLPRYLIRRSRGSGSDSDPSDRSHDH